MEIKKTLAIFDFDGTISSKDSMFDFICFAVGKPKFYWGLLLQSPMLIAYLVRLIPNDLAKQKLLSYFFKGYKQKIFKQKAQQYCATKIHTIIRPKALKKINWHKENTHRIIILSASIECWLKPWCEQHNIELISTKLEIIDDKLSGSLATKNCNGQEKLTRLKEYLELNEFEYIYAYGDSKGDKAMLSIATQAYYKPFR